MKINPEYLRLLETENLANTPSQRARGIFFGFLMTFQQDHPELKDYLLDEEEHRAIFPYEDFQVYQIKLCQTNSDTLKIELKVPLFGGLATGEFEEFLRILTTHNINSKGYLNAQLEYSIFDSNLQVDKDVYNAVKSNLGEDYDIYKVAKTVANYYMDTKFASKLAKYLGGAGFIQDYKQ